MTTCAPGLFIDLIRGLRCQIFCLQMLQILTVTAMSVWTQQSPGSLLENSSPIKFIMTSVTETVIGQLSFHGTSHYFPDVLLTMAGPSFNDLDSYLEKTQVFQSC